MKSLFQLRYISAGFTAIVVGYTSSIIIVIQAATASGASDSYIASWLFTLGVAMGCTSILYSWFLKTPILMAWSTSGAAMLVTAVSGYQLEQIVGAFIVNGILIVITGLIKPLNRLLTNISPQIATAMLAAILLPICMAAFSPVNDDAVTFFVMFISFLLAKRYYPTFAMLILLIVSLVLTMINGTFDQSELSLTLPYPVWMSAQFDGAAILNIALPLYIITMLSQNLPGIAMIKSHGYHINTSPVFIGSGFINALLAPFGVFSVNLAAISAAICMNDDVDKDTKQRYKAVIWAGIFYLAAGVFGATIADIFMILPDSISKILAGLALFGTLVMCLKTMVLHSEHREAAVLTFIIASSGVSLFGISAPILGLISGTIYSKLFAVTSKH